MALIVIGLYYAYSSSTSKRCPARTCCPASRQTLTTRPACGASTSISIFIDSMISNGWPALTCSPFVDQHLPDVTGDQTFHRLVMIRQLFLFAGFQHHVAVSALKLA